MLLFITIQGSRDVQIKLLFSPFRDAGVAVKKALDHISNNTNNHLVNDDFIDDVIDRKMLDNPENEGINEL